MYIFTKQQQQQKPTDHFKVRWFQQNKMRITQMPRLLLENQLAMIEFGRRLRYPVKWRQQYRISPEKGTATERPWNEVEDRNLTSIEVGMFPSMNYIEWRIKQWLDWEFKWCAKLCRSRRVLSILLDLSHYEAFKIYVKNDEEHT